MGALNALFRQRINLPDHLSITFETLDRVLEQTARMIPFENMHIIEHRTGEITKERLMDRMLVNNEGGLCYELNSLLYFFLVDNGFDAVLTRGIVYNNAERQYAATGRTHVTILLNHGGRTYVVDTGFGGNLPLRPVPLSGQTAVSGNGEFRVRPVCQEHGDYVLEMKLKYKDSDWRIGYAFDSGKPATDISEFDEIQTIIAEHEQSPFNKQPLLTRRTEDGNITLTDSSFTRWANGTVSKEAMDRAKFEELLRQYFRK